jgi:type 1 glutamine amidotransferase
MYWFRFLLKSYLFPKAHLPVWILTKVTIVVFMSCLLANRSVAQSTKRPKKVVLIAGKKSHGPGEHEYLKSVQLLKVMLDKAPNLKGISTEIHANGWPSDPATLDDADVIFMYADGTDFGLANDPLFVDDHWRVIEKQMKRGCGLVVMHYSTFAPSAYSQAFMEWVGGYFDYESGKPGASGKEAWYSAITTETALLKPVAHPVARGLAPFKLHEELYYKIHFLENDKRLKPVITAGLSGVETEQTVAWAVERKYGGRGFGFTGGHFYTNWQEPNYRKLLLNAIVWAAGGKVPADGIVSQFYTDEQIQAHLK